MCSVKTVNMKNQATVWENIFVIHISDRGLLSRIYKEVWQLNQKTSNPVFLKQWIQKIFFFFLSKLKNHFGFFLLLFFIYLFIYFWLCWVFVSVRGLSLVVASGGHSSSQCTGLSLSWPLLLRSTGSRSAGSVVVAHGPSCSAAFGIFPDQGSNPCPLHWQADSQPLRHQGSPRRFK